MAKATETIKASIELPIARRELFELFTEGANIWLSPESFLPPKVGEKLCLALRTPPQQVHGREWGRGEVTAVERDRMISFTYGKEDAFDMPPGTSQITVRFEDVPGGTRFLAEQEIHEHPTHTAEFLPNGVPRPDDYNFGFLIGRIEIFWRLVIGWLAGTVRERSLGAVNEMLAGWVKCWTDLEPADMPAYIEKLCTPDLLVKDATAGYIFSRDELSVHFQRVREHLPPGFEVRMVGKPRIAFNYALISVEGRMANGQVVTTADHFVHFGAGPKICTVEIVWDPQSEG